jgi:hypothetical protein
MSYILTADLPLLEKLHQGKLPDAWQPLDTSTRDEVVFLAPLEIVSTRGRAQKLFGFEYLWEVYKPREKRRWGYYTLPVLYHDQLVARLDPRMDRTSGGLEIQGFWLEEATKLNVEFLYALTKGMRRFMEFVSAREVDLTAIQSTDLRQFLQERL